ncbi:MAG: SEC-C domain-containing protein [Lysobacter sp.]|nr:MAG: SEC-C domain-containing protein [Lysobacter sp.]
MTLLVALANSRQAVLVADRRITSAGKVVDDEFNKLCVFCCDDARGAFAFTGIATAGNFSTSEWLWQTLNAAGADHEELIAVLAFLTERADRDINTLPVADRRLSVLFCGYLYHAELPEPACYLMSNFEFEAAGTGKFQVSRLDHGTGQFVHAAGTSTGFERRHRERLEALLSKPLSAPALVRASVLKLQESAGNPDGFGVIGSQCSSAALLAERDTTITTTYHSNFESLVAYGPHVVINRGLIVCSSEIFSCTALAGPEIRKTDPCWCESGMTFGECHLQKFGSYYVRFGTLRTPMYAVAGMEFDPPRRSGRIFWVASGYQ